MDFALQPRSSLRKQGPITTGLSGCGKMSREAAFAGTTGGWILSAAGIFHCAEVDFFRQ